MRRSAFILGLLVLATACAEQASQGADAGGAPSAGATQAGAGQAGTIVAPAASAAPEGGTSDAGSVPRGSRPPRASTADDAGDDDSGQTSADASGPTSTDAPSAVVLDERDTLVPDATWTCGLPDGIPGPSTGQFAFAIDFEVAQERDIGTTPFGRRRRIDLGEGTVEGARVAGRVLAGGLEYELTLDNGVVELEQIDVLQLGDDLVFMRNCGVSPDPGVSARIVLGMEAAKDGKYAFLNEGEFIATHTYDAAMKRVRLEVYELTSAPSAANVVRVRKPPGRPSQSWTCKPSAGAQGAEVYQATIDVATEWWTVGESKFGVRNIIPIHGGSMSGRIHGRVLSGGADYQVIVDNYALDARYALQTDDGEIIIVRNCGELGALVPTFETRSDGPYAWLNQGSFLSTDPAPNADLSQINLTIYEAQ